jgi:hypothetical protein
MRKSAIFMVGWFSTSMAFAVDWSGHSWPVVIKANLWMDEAGRMLAGPVGLVAFLSVLLAYLLGWPVDALGAALHSLSCIWRRREGRSLLRTAAILWRKRWLQNRKSRKYLSETETFWLNLRRETIELRRPLREQTASSLQPPSPCEPHPCTPASSTTQESGQLFSSASFKS